MSQTQRIYLDYAAATPIDPAVERAMAPFAAQEFANPSSLYVEGRAAQLALDDARRRMARCLGAKPSEIVFTAGATEAINLAILGIARRFAGAKIVTTTIEHQAVLGCMMALAGQEHPIDFIAVGTNGLVKLEEIERAIDDETALVCVGLANGEIGTVQPLAKLGAIIQNVRADRAARGIELPLYLMSDASAAAGYQSLQVSRLGVDLMVLNGAKLYGPKQSGALYVRTGTTLVPLIYGGGQERGLRSGTESVAATVGLATALELAEASRDAETKRLGTLRDRLEVELIKIEGVTVNGAGPARLPNNLNLTIEGAGGEDLVYRLDAAGIAAATGAACSAASDQPSHVLLGIGRTAAQANQSLRLTLGRPTTPAEVTTAAAIIARTIAELRAAR